MSKRKSYIVPQQQVSMFELDTPSMPTFDKSRCVAKLVNYETAARMVEAYHYAHRVPSIVIAVGLFVDETLAGVCCYGIPANNNLSKAFGGYGVIELNRLFIFDWVGRNSESWLIGQSFKLTPKEYPVLVSYADIGQEHIGYIYQATNWLYTGLGDPGGATEKIVNGQKMHAKAVYNTYQTNDVDDLRSKGLQVEVIKKSLKHRYVYFLGPKKQRQLLRGLLKWPVLPYPKKSEP